MKRLSTSIVAVLFLAACGGGGGSSSSKPVQDVTTGGDVAGDNASGDQPTTLEGDNPVTPTTPTNPTTPPDPLPSAVDQFGQNRDRPDLVGYIPRLNTIMPDGIEYGIGGSFNRALIIELDQDDFFEGGTLTPHNTLNVDLSVNPDLIEIDASAFTQSGFLVSGTNTIALDGPAGWYTGGLLAHESLSDEAFIITDDDGDVFALGAYVDGGNRFEMISVSARVLRDPQFTPRGTATYRSVGSNFPVYFEEVYTNTITGDQFNIGKGLGLAATMTVNFDTSDIDFTGNIGGGGDPVGEGGLTINNASGTLVGQGQLIRQGNDVGFFITLDSDESSIIGDSGAFAGDFRRYSVEGDLFGGIGGRDGEDATAVFSGTGSNANGDTGVLIGSGLLTTR